MRGRPYKFPAERRAQIVAWWREHVSPHHGGNRRNPDRNRSDMPVQLAEKLCGVTQATISRWRNQK